MLRVSGRDLVTTKEKEVCWLQLRIKMDISCAREKYKVRNRLDHCLHGAEPIEPIKMIAS